MNEWKPLSLSSSLYAPASASTPAPVIGKLDELPFTSLSWENFERLQLRMMRDVEGLRDAQLYGERGQAQLGLDIVALAPDGAGVALQSKNYNRFYASQLRAAVKKFRDTKRPFEVQRLIIGVACAVKSTGAIDELATQRKALHPIVIDLWDAQELSTLLRGRPEIVIEYFGMPTAEAFCLPFKIDVAHVPSADAAAVREAIARTPEVSTGAQELFDKAAITTEATQALILIEEGQAALRKAGFGPHAASHDKERVRLLARTGQEVEAARQVLDDFWAALDQGLSATAQLTQSRIDELSNLAAGNETVDRYRKVIETAISLYINPLGYLPDIDSLRNGDPADQARLILLAGETALAGDESDWLNRAAPVFAEFSRLPALDEVLVTRLRLLVAESTHDWTELLTDARKLTLGYGISGLVTARHARSLARHQKFVEADLAWDEASGFASLASQWGEASTWIFSRRAYRSRWNPFTSNELLPLQTAIREMGSSKPLVPTSESAYVDSLSALAEGNLRSGAISAQRALRDAITTSDWVGEERARRVLASILIESDEPALAAHHLAQVGATKQIETLGKSLSLEFLDITADLDAPNYWTVGATYRLLSAQADLVPDALVSSIAEHITDELDAAEKGTRPDLRAFAPSRYNNAIRALAGIAGRIDLASATAALSHFERQPVVEENHYRYHDDDEALAVARIAVRHPSLAPRAMAHLVPLLGRAQGARTHTTRDVIEKYNALAHDGLTALAAAGNHWAQETLALGDPSDIDPDVASAALARLTSPLTHAAGVYSAGTNAVGDSLLVTHLAPELINTATAALLVRADDPHINSGDRGEYLIAASNLGRHLTEAQRTTHFETAMRLATSPTPSDHDALNEQYTHKLGGFRIDGMPRSSRGQALALAATLASTEIQRKEVRRVVYSLLGEKEDYWPTMALQRLGDTVKDDLAFLATQGWAIRSLVAGLWATHGEPEHLGERLARDPDVRVRRALARALVQQTDRKYPGVLDALAADPAHSVRTVLTEGGT
ncbi:hypothetical protein GE115_09605 [Agromyces sp. CFH 90414]|uniref:Uncharacterized protein n=1 Tax=Agromyces agglutinans TaxID=2662258 RepID=A0A6I2F790_9MICO|nr:hypothetical protein [Agromyces agglutinans]MRG60124.1 hypothetical protein [Agromyces agglutinans]